MFQSSVDTQDPGMTPNLILKNKKNSDQHYKTTKRYELMFAIVLINYSPYLLVFIRSHPLQWRENRPQNH